MEHVQKSRVSDVRLITSRTVVYTLMLTFSVLFGVLNFVIPTHLLAAVIVIAVAGILLFMYPFLGLLSYQFITVIKPAVIFPSLAVLHPERMMAIFLIVSLIINIKLRREKLIVTEHKLIYLIGFFILAMGLSVPTSYWPSQSVDKIINFLKLFAYVLLIINILRTPKRLKIFVWQFLILIGYMAVSSAIAYKTGNVMEAQGIIRAQGLAKTDPNTLANTLVLALPFHFMLLKQEKNKLLKLLSAFLVLATVYTMVLTGSRGGMLGLITVVIVSWFVLPNKGIRMFFLLAAAFTVIALMPQQYQERYASIVAEDRDESSQQRLKVWGKGLRMFIDRPFTGVGTGAFSIANAEGYSEGRKSYLAPHSLYIQLIAELGIVGLITFGLYVSALFYYQKKYRHYLIDKFKRRTWLWGLLMGMTLSLITLMVVGIFGHSLYRSNWYYYGGLTIAVGYIIARLDLYDQNEVKHVT